MLARKHSVLCIYRQGLHGQLVGTAHEGEYNVQCYATDDAVQIVNWFITISHSQSFIMLCHIYTTYNLTRQYSILDVYTYSHFK
jgi:hypothetical protein